MPPSVPSPSLARCLPRLTHARPLRPSSTTASTSAPKLAVPANAWDSHMHVTDPDAFPLAPGALYKPHAAPLSQALSNARRLSLPNLVFVQPSVYGTDNSCLLHALAALPSPHRGRGVVVFDPDTTSAETLREWHGLGVRGVRVNLKSVGAQMPPEELAQLLRKFADAIRPLRTWALQIYADLAVVADVRLARLVPELGVKVVVDHFGSPPPLAQTSTQPPPPPGWTALLDTLQHPDAYVKVSAPYRFSSDPEYREVEGLVKQILAVRAGEAGVFASDFPHTRFEGVDVRPFVSRCLEWCGEDEGLREKLFRRNAERLWDAAEE